MRAVEFRLLLAIVVVMLGATLIVGLNFSEDDDPMALVCQTQPMHVNSEERSCASLDGPTSAPPPSRTESEITIHSSASVIDLVCVLRC